jgi:hypothetical protein
VTRDSGLSAARARLIGFTAGVLNGLIGIGGGIVIVPGLIFHRGASPQVAVGTSLAAVVVLSSVAFLLHASLTGFGFGITGLVVVIVSGVAGAWFGAWLLARVSSHRMLLLFSVFILFVSIRLLAQGFELGLEPPRWTGTPPAWAYPAIGFASGVLSGLFGVGGGALVLLGFAVFFGMPVHEGLAVALAVNVTNALVGCVRHGRAGRILWREVARMAPAAVVGIMVGTAAALWLPPDALRTVFGFFFLFMGVKMGHRALARREIE